MIYGAQKIKLHLIFKDRPCNLIRISESKREIYEYPTQCFKDFEDKRTFNVFKIIVVY